jgi:ABC-2 type transport system ATP-binding protein
MLESNHSIVSSQPPSGSPFLMLDIPASPHNDIGAAPPPITVKDLVKSYGPVTAVAGIGFTIASGSRTALLGGNGAGKTTTIAMLLGLILPTSGKISIFGEDMTRHRYRVLHRMNFVSPYVNLPMRLTVRQNLETFASLYGVARPSERVADLAHELRLDEFLDRPAGSLSAGQKTRVALAKALINAPELLLLDEPTASLDPDTADWVRAKLRDYQAARGATLLLASHNMFEVERMAERVIMLEKGRIVEDGAPAELLSRYGRENLEDVFLDIVRGRQHAMTRDEPGGKELQGAGNAP